MRIVLRLQDRALDAKRESKSIEFKSEFDVTSSEQWCEIIKDLVAISNSVDGIILFGVNKDGSCSGFDCSQILTLDPAVITDKVAKYTGIQFSGFDVLELAKSGHTIAAIEIRHSKVPMVLVTEGAYSVGGRVKTAFAKGTLYFRHGAKSEPADSHDLYAAIERERESVRTSLLRRINTVVEVPLDKEVTVQSASPGSGPSLPVVLSDDPASKKLGLLDTNRTHPYRLKDVVELVNKRLKDSARINSYNVQCIRQVHGIDGDLRYYYKPLHSSPHYSQLFVGMLIDGYAKDDSYFRKAQAKCRT